MIPELPVVLEDILMAISNTTLAAGSTPQAFISHMLFPIALPDGTFQRESSWGVFHHRLTTCRHTSEPRVPQ